MFCGELICEEPADSTTCELSPFPRSCTQMINALVAVCERFQGEGIGSAMAGRIPAEREEPRAPDSHALLGHPTAEGVGAAPESDDTVTIIGGEANIATVAVTSAEAVVPAAEAVRRQQRLQLPLPLLKRHQVHQLHQRLQLPRLRMLWRSLQRKLSRRGPRRKPCLLLEADLKGKQGRQEGLKLLDVNLL